jgi:hypothetical protein
LLQGLALLALQRQPGYHEVDGASDLSTHRSPENTTIYLVGLGQILTVRRFC